MTVTVNVGVFKGEVPAPVVGRGIAVPGVLVGVPVPETDVPERVGVAVRVGPPGVGVTVNVGVGVGVAVKAFGVADGPGVGVGVKVGVLAPNGMVRVIGP